VASGQRQRKHGGEACNLIPLVPPWLGSSSSSGACTPLLSRVLHGVNPCQETVSAATTDYIHISLNLNSVLEIRKEAQSLIPAVRNEESSWALVAHVCDPSYSGGRDCSSKPAPANSS
jgi:hypothetical protein